MKSNYTKPQSLNTGVANASIVGGGPVRMPLNRDNLTVQHSVHVKIEQAASVAPTAAADAFQLIEKLEIETERGIEYSTNGQDLAAINQITAAPSSQRNTLGLANVISFGFDIYSKHNGALHDLLTAIESGKRKKYNLNITFAKSAAVIFTGGTLTGSPTYTVEVEAKTYPSLTGEGKVQTYEVNGETVTNEYFMIGELMHKFITNNKPGTQSGALEPVQMVSAGAIMRFLMLTCWDTTGAAPVPIDSLVDTVRIVAGGSEKFSSTFEAMQRRNEAERSLTLLGSGTAWVDYGDDESEWLDMGDIQDARLYLTVKPGAPASYEIHISEDSTMQA